MSSLPYEPPRYEAAHGIARITLARPAYRNRLHNEDLERLLQLFAQVDADPAIRVVVLTAEVLAQRPVFSAGYHTGEFEEGKPAANFEQVVEALERVRPLTICALNGSVYGGATDFVLACDFAIGAEGIEMRMPAAALGLHYYASGLARYVSRLGVSVAKRAFLTAQALDAQTLLRVGYLQELVPREQLEARVDALAAQLKTLAPRAAQDMKASLNEIARGEFDVERIRERERASAASEDFAEGRKAFTERRAPVWKGR
ncbi:enoyl-CoA hydratase/isomerase family protein [Ramlibacter sp. G-1-2-2]|uniref:Enoyl-CoA hydratase/isomerase family protein n=1 Tax=Ramlibacter agri TaxID=2728837 RepID=A0A848H6I2_9BURK|nr:enoyl-CoA hydratase/isomerase family protein [Ramlibacter agri]NML44173.1 enoyl-CoA hydratase/isomerase family protein [Ramlibacter agri]